MPPPPGAGSLWSYDSKRMSVGIDSETGQVLLWYNNDPLAAPQAPSAGQEAITVDVAWDTAEDWCKRAGFPIPPRDEAFQQVENGIPYAYLLRFKDKKEHKVGVGNLATIEINTFTGEAILFIRAVGYTYETPTVVISEQVAKASMKRRLLEVYGVTPDSLEVSELKYSLGGSGALRDTRALTRPKRRTFLIYNATARVGRAEFYGSVDAKNGLLVDGGLSRSGGQLPGKGGKALQPGSSATLIPGSNAPSQANLQGLPGPIISQPRPPATPERQPVSNSGFVTEVILYVVAGGLVLAAVALLRRL